MRLAKLIKNKINNIKKTVIHKNFDPSNVPQSGNNRYADLELEDFISIKKLGMKQYLKGII